MSLEDHAKRELKLAGYYDEKTGMNALMAKNVMELITVFAKQGHSGFSASFCVELFRILASYEPLIPLTGADDEWVDVSQYGAEPKYQNKRCSRVFKNSDGSCFDVNAIVFEDFEGCRYTGNGSSQPVTFPYTPTTRIVKK